MVSLTKYFSNSFWLFSERLVNALGTMAVTIFTARYLGPDKMGMINYAVALASMIIPISQLGSQTLIFDKTAKNKVTGEKLIISSKAIKSYVFSALSIVVLLYHLHSGSESLLILIQLGILFSSYFTVMDAYGPYFNATFNSRVNSFGTQIGVISALVLRLVLVFISATPLYFSLPYIINTAIPYWYRKNKFDEKKNDIYISKITQGRYQKFSIRAGIPLAIAGASSIIYVKTSQVVLANTLGVYEVGLYNSASIIGQGWSFVPLVFTTVVFAKLFGLKDEKIKHLGFSLLMIFSVISSMVAASIIAINSEFILAITYGDKFVDAATLIPILSLATVFSVIGTISYRIIIHYTGYKYLMYKMVFSAVLNFFISVYLIEIYGLVGAALSVAITELLSATLFNFFFMKGILIKIHMEPFKFIKRRIKSV